MSKKEITTPARDHMLKIINQYNRETATIEMKELIIAVVRYEEEAQKITSESYQRTQAIMEEMRTDFDNELNKVKQGTKEDLEKIRLRADRQVRIISRKVASEKVETAGLAIKSAYHREFEARKDATNSFIQYEEIKTKEGKIHQKRVSNGKKNSPIYAKNETLIINIILEKQLEAKQSNKKEIKKNTRRKIAKKIGFSKNEIPNTTYNRWVECLKSNENTSIFKP